MLDLFEGATWKLEWAKLVFDQRAPSPIKRIWLKRRRRRRPLRTTFGQVQWERMTFRWFGRRNEGTAVA